MSMAWAVEVLSDVTLVRYERASPHRRSIQNEGSARGSAGVHGVRCAGFWAMLPATH